MKTSAILFTALPFFLAAAAMMVPGCAPKKEVLEPEPVFAGDIKQQQDGNINLYFEIAREFNDGEHRGDVCDALVAAKELMNRYKRAPTEFNMTWPGIRQLENENHCP